MLKKYRIIDASELASAFLMYLVSPAHHWLAQGLNSAIRITEDTCAWRLPGSSRFIGQLGQGRLQLGDDARSLTAREAFAAGGND
jgi:hypothetical protein